MAGMFQGCEGLTSLNLSYLKTDEVTNMSYLFYHCTGLTDLDLGSLHTHKVVLCQEKVQIKYNQFSLFM